MKNKYNRNGLVYFLVLIVTVIVYLVIHLYCDGLRKDVFKENSDYENNLNRQPINNIITTDKTPVPTPPVQDDEVKSLSFAQKNVSVKKGDVIRLIVQIKPAGLSSSKFTWKSSNPSVVTVDENGYIKGLKEGTAIITVTSPNGKTATVKVTVEPKEIKVKKITLNPNKLSLEVGSSSQISAIIGPENATNRKLVWESSDPNIATVDDNGVVKGISPGTVTITVKTEDGTVTSQITVTIKPKEIESLSFAQDNISVKIGDTAKLIVQVKPTESASTPLTWKSSDPSIVSVDENGNITGLKEGTVTITVTSPDGKTATIKVTVQPDDIKVEKITLSPSKLSLDVGEVKQISATIEPTNATNRELIWESSNPSVATVDDKGVVEGISPGTTTITAKTKDGTVVSTSTVTVNSIPVPQIESLSFAEESVSIKIGDTLRLLVQVQPTELASTPLTWTSSNPSIVSVDENGYIKGLKEGTTTITVTSPNGKTATIKVTVQLDEIKVEKIILSPSELSLDVGEVKQVSAVIEPANATNRELVWESSNPSVATVDDKGVVEGISPGTTTITVKTDDGTVVSQITVTVKTVVTPTPTPENIIFEYDYDDSNYIYLIDQFPIRDEVGKSLQGEKHTQDFKLRFNKAAAGVRYVITMEKLDGSDLDEKWAKTFLVNDGVDVQNCYRANGRVKSFDEFEMYNGNPKEKILYEGVVSSSESVRGYKDFTFRMWVSEDLQLNNSNYLSETKTFKTRINVYAVG